MPILKRCMTRTKRDKKKIFTIERLRIHVRNMYSEECMVSVQYLPHGISKWVYFFLRLLIYLKIFMICLISADCSNEENNKSEMLQTMMKCKNYTSGQPTLIVGDTSGRLGNHIWSYVFLLAVKVMQYTSFELYE